MLQCIMKYVIDILMEDQEQVLPLEVSRSTSVPKAYRQKTFQGEISRLLRKKGTTFSRIASGVGIEGTGAVRAGELLRRCVASERTLVGYDYPSLSRALIARYLSDSQEQYQCLLALAKESRRVQRTRQRSIGLSAIRDERELYGLSPEDVEPRIGYCHDELLRIEQGRKRISSEEESQIVDVICAEGEARIQRVLESARRAPSTVRAFVEHLVKKNARTGFGDHYKQFADRMPGIGHELLKLIVRGEEMPGLPVIGCIVSTGGEALTEKLIEDWSYEYTVQELQKGGTFLARVFHTVCAEKYRSPYEFYGVHGTSMKKSLQRFKKGAVCEWKSIRKALLQLGVQENSPRWLLMECLFRKRDVREALKNWYEEVRRRDLPIDLSFRSLPGLTREESPKPVFDGVMEKMKELYPHCSNDDAQRIADCVIPMAIDGMPIEEILGKIEQDFGAYLNVQEQRALRRERLFSWIRMRDPVFVDSQKERCEQAVDEALTEDVPEPVARTKVEQFLAVQRLVEQARSLDGETVRCAEGAVGEVARWLVEKGADACTCERILQQTVLVERVMQWAYLRYLDTVSGYYQVLKSIVKRAVEEGRGEEEIRTILEGRITELSLRSKV